MPNHHQLDRDTQSLWTALSAEASAQYAGTISMNSPAALPDALNVNKNPYMEINYGTGKPVADESIKDAVRPLRIDWYNGSRITVPVMGYPMLHAGVGDP